MIGIYKITSPKGRVYIGQSREIENRFSSYKREKEANKTQVRLIRSFNKYGVGNHTFEIIEECEIDQLNIRERFWQDHYDVLNGGLNCILTETDILSRVYSNETKERRSGENHWAWGKTMSEDSRKKMSESAKLRKASVKTKEKLSEIRKGEGNSFYSKRHTDSTKKIQSEKKKGENNIRSKIVLDTQTGIFYYGIQEAADLLSMKYDTLYFQLTGRNKNKTNLQLV